MALDGSESEDLDGGELKYKWVVERGSTFLKPRLTNADTPKATLWAVTGTTVKLTVTDEMGASHSVTKYITIEVIRTIPVPNPTPPPPPPTPTPTPTPEEAPPAPTNSQWDIRHSDGKIHAKVTEIPGVNPAITQVRVHMSTGQPPNQTTVTKAIGTTLNTWVDVLASGDTGWAANGTWTAHIRFENSVGNSAYSLPGKSVTVTLPSPTPDPEPTPHAG